MEPGQLRRADLAALDQDRELADRQERQLIGRGGPRERVARGGLCSIATHALGRSRWGGNEGQGRWDRVAELDLAQTFALAEVRRDRSGAARSLVVGEVQTSTHSTCLIISGVTALASAACPAIARRNVALPTPSAARVFKMVRLATTACALPNGLIDSPASYPSRRAVHSPPFRAPRREDLCGE